MRVGIPSLLNAAVVFDAAVVLDLLLLPLVFFSHVVIAAADGEVDIHQTRWTRRPRATTTGYHHHDGDGVRRLASRLNKRGAVVVDAGDASFVSLVVESGLVEEIGWLYYWNNLLPQHYCCSW